MQFINIIFRKINKTTTEGLKITPFVGLIKTNTKLNEYEKHISLFDGNELKENFFNYVNMKKEIEINICRTNLNNSNYFEDYYELSDLFLEQVWSGINNEGFQYFTRRTSIKDIYLIIGMAFFKNDLSEHEHSSFLLKNNKLQFIKNTDKICIGESYKSIMQNFKWNIDDDFYHIHSDLSDITIKNINNYRIAQIKKFKNIKLTDDDKKYLNYIDNIDFKSIVTHNDPNFIKFLEILYDNNLLNQDKNLMKWDEYTKRKEKVDSINFNPKLY